MNRNAAIFPLYALPFLLLLITAPAAVGAPAAELRVPASRAYSEPRPEAISISDETGATGWTDSRDNLVWYVQLARPGALDVSVLLRLPRGDRSTFRMAVSRVDRPGFRKQLAEAESPRRTPGPMAFSSDGAGAETSPQLSVMLPLGRVSTASRGSYRFELVGVSHTGPTFGDIQALVLDGPGAAGAHFSQEDGRGAPSVHLWYSFPKQLPVVAFYNEVTAKADPLWSYYMGCGFSRGYFGIQVNSPTERRIIFSVWDAGNEPTDRGKVKPENRVQLLAKGDGVFAGGFGNEGTGGHSHLVYPWKTGHTYRLLVTAQPEGDATIYSGYFYFPERKKWGLIASFRAPKDGGTLRGLYSFNEDFSGANGEQRREAEFGPQWIRTADGQWRELTTAQFTFTSNGRTDRLDREAGVRGERFFLSNGGFVPSPMPYGTPLHRHSSGRVPNVPAVLFSPERR